MKSRRGLGLNNRFFCQLIFIILCAGCLSPLDRFAEYSGGQLVVSGQISTLSETNAVEIGRTSDRERLPEPVLDASVTLHDNHGNVYTFTPDLAVAGKYVLPDFAGVPGIAYHIEVKLPGGQRYLSTPEELPADVGFDEVYYSIEPDEYIDGEGTIAQRDFLKIYTNHTLPQSTRPLFLRWHVEEVYMLSPTDFPDPFGNIPPSCYIAQQVEPQRIILFDTEHVDALFIPDMLVVQRLIDRSFKEKHYFTTFHSSLTREAYEYWEKVDIVANQTGSIFDEPPARVKGNIRNAENPAEEIHGYFQSVNQSYQRFYLLPDDLPYGMPIHCEYRNDRDYFDYPSECLDCTSVRNSSYNRPSWF